MEWFSPSALGNNPKPTRNPPKKPNATPFSKEMITQIVTFLGRAEDCLDVSAKIDNFLSRLPPKAPKTADMVGTIHPRRFQVSCLRLAEVPDVDDNLGFSRDSLANHPHDANHPLEIESVHGHQEKCVEFSRSREVVGAAEDVLVAHYTRLECRVAFTETAEFALARTGCNLDANLSKDNAFIVEPPSRDGVADGTQKGSFEGCLREFQ